MDETKSICKLCYWSKVLWSTIVVSLLLLLTWLGLHDHRGLANRSPSILSLLHTGLLHHWLLHHHRLLSHHGLLLSTCIHRLLHHRLGLNISPTDLYTTWVLNHATCVDWLLRCWHHGGLLDVNHRWITWVNQSELLLKVGRRALGCQRLLRFIVSNVLQGASVDSIEA